MIELVHRKEGTILVVEMRGSLALNAVDETRNSLKKHMNQDNITGLLLNMKGLEFIDSAGIGLLVTLFKFNQERSGQFALCGLSSQNKEIFQITRLDTIFNVYASEEMALKKLKAKVA